MSDEEIKIMQNALNSHKIRNYKKKIFVIKMSTEPETKVISVDQINAKLAEFDAKFEAWKKYFDANKDGKINGKDIVLLLKMWLKVFIVIIGIEMFIPSINSQLMAMLSTGIMDWEFIWSQILLGGVIGLFAYIKQSASMEMGDISKENKSLKEENALLKRQINETATSQCLTDQQTQFAHQVELMKKDQEITDLKLKLPRAVAVTEEP